MNISDVLSEDMVLIDVDADSKRRVLEHIADCAAAQFILDRNAVFEALWERENLGTTGYGGGAAFPHARLAGLTKTVSGFVRLNRPIDYDAMDNKQVDLLAFLLSPEHSGEDHLQALAVFSRVLKNTATCHDIRQARTASEVYRLLQK